jgi:hypothetical protein
MTHEVPDSGGANFILLPVVLGHCRPHCLAAGRLPAISTFPEDT